MIPVGLIAERNQHLNKDERLGKKVSQSAPQISERTPDEPSSNNGKSKDETKTSWRKFLCGIVFGHAPNAEEIFGSFNNNHFKSAIAANFILSILFSISSVTFASNPVSGLVILVTMFYSAPSSVILGLASLISGILTSLWITRFPKELTIRGSITFNCFLFGSFLGPLSGFTFYYQMSYLIPISFASGIFVIFIYGGLHGTFDRVDLPVLNAPCNALALLFVCSGMNNVFLHESPGLQTFTFSNEIEPNLPFNETVFNGSHLLTNTDPETQEERDSVNLIDFYKILEGIILSQGQIFQTNSVNTSLLVWLSMLIYSPILFFQEFIGSAIGTLIGLLLSDKNYVDGSWGFNPLLTSGSIGGTFIAYNFQSFFLSLVGSVLTSLLYAAFVKNGFPAFGIPFNIITLLLLPLAKRPNDSDDEENVDHSCYTLYRVTTFTTPEINQKCLKIQVSNKKYFRPKCSVLPL